MWALQAPSAGWARGAHAAPPPVPVLPLCLHDVRSSGSSGGQCPGLRGLGWAPFRAQSTAQLLCASAKVQHLPQTRCAPLPHPDSTTASVAHWDCPLLHLTLPRRVCVSGDAGDPGGWGLPGVSARVLWSQESRASAGRAACGVDTGFPGPSQHVCARTQHHWQLVSPLMGGVLWLGRVHEGAQASPRATRRQHERLLCFGLEGAAARPVSPASTS